MMGSMPLLERILFTCRHQFSWPRRADDGNGYYQICLHCGTKYGYDWSSMRRIAPIAQEAEEVPLGKRGPHKTGARTWMPRARRLKVHMPVYYRLVEEGNWPEREWMEGQSENISRSGLLFHVREALPEGAAIEVKFEMPAEIAGEPGQVLCRTQVVRVLEDKNGSKLAVAIGEYTFVLGQRAG